jgi:hypothetical protein
VFEHTLTVGDPVDPDARRREWTVEGLQGVRQRLNRHDLSAEQDRRRAEDRIREELQDSRATTIRGPQS